MIGVPEGREKGSENILEEIILLGSASFASPSLHSFRLETASFTPEPAASAPLETFP